MIYQNGQKVLEKVVSLIGPVNVIVSKILEEKIESIVGS